MKKYILIVLLSCLLAGSLFASGSSEKSTNESDGPSGTITFSILRDNLHSKVLKFMNDTRDPFRGYQWKLRPWNKDKVSISWECDGYTRQRPRDINEIKQLDYDTGLETTEDVRLKFIPSVSRFNQLKLNKM